MSSASTLLLRLDDQTTRISTVIIDSSGAFHVENREVMLDVTPASSHRLQDQQENH